MRTTAIWAAVAAVLAGVACGASDDIGWKTPETSRLFVRHVDPSSGVESWLLKPGIFSFHQQGCYFTQKSMTDDGRFIFFWARDPEFEPDGKTKKKNRLNTTALIDFKTDTIVDLHITTQIPFLDVKTDQLWYFRTVKDKGTTERHVCRRDFLVDPLKEIVVCKVPDALLKDVKKVHYLSTHPTLTTDRKKMFIAARLDNRDAIAYKKKTGWYPRMWLAYPDGRRELQPSRIPNHNYATHEHWAEDGKGFYWCARGVHYQDLATGKQETVSPWPGAHATMSANNRLVTFDMSVGKWYRGCQWKVGFWNRDTKQGVYIHSVRPKLCDDDGGWHDHPDPHPAFVCKDRYILCTMNGDDHRMNLSLTPVAPLVAQTQKKEEK